MRDVESSLSEDQKNHIRVLIQLMEDFSQKPSTVAIRPDRRHPDQSFGKADEDGRSCCALFNQRDDSVQDDHCAQFIDPQTMGRRTQ